MFYPSHHLYCYLIISLFLSQLEVAPALASLSDEWVGQVTKNNQIETACFLVERDIVRIRAALDAKLAASSSSSPSSSSSSSSTASSSSSSSSDEMAH
jgi:hypothetical protein